MNITNHKLMRQTKSSFLSFFSSFLLYRHYQSNNFKEFYQKFWKLQEILCNRDYVTKTPALWHDFKVLMEYVLREMEKIKDVTTAEEQNKGEMRTDQLFVKMNEVEDTGRLSLIVNESRE